MASMVVTVILACLGAASVMEGPLPEELRYIETLARDESALVDAVRNFDLMQVGFAKWDLELAKELAEAGETELAEAYFQQMRRRFLLVARAYEETISLYPKNARAINNYGELLYDHLGDGAKAVQSWKLAAAMDSKLAAPLNNLAIFYCHGGEYDRGLGYFERLIKLDPNHPDYLYNLCQIYLIHPGPVARRYKWKPERVYREAMKLSKRAADLRPDDFDLLQDYAVNFRAAERFGVKADWRAAAAAWQRARARARNKDQEFYTWINEARVWIDHGDKSKARACLEQALAIRPDSGPAQELMVRVSGDSAGS